MASDFEDFLEITQTIADLPTLTARFHQAMTDEGYDNLVFVRVGSGRKIDVLGADVPDGYGDAYAQNGWHAIDPVLRQSRIARQPFLWDEVSDRSADPAAEARFFAECKAIGVHSGLTMPFHNPDRRTHIISVSLRERERPDPRRIPYLYALAAQTWVRSGAIAAAAEGNDAGAGQVILTGRERECLIWAKDGKTNWEISRILSVAERTVEFHIGNVMRKLNATNRITAIVIALQEGLISI